MEKLTPKELRALAQDKDFLKRVKESVLMTMLAAYCDGGFNGKFQIEDLIRLYDHPLENLPDDDEVLKGLIDNISIMEV